MGLGLAEFIGIGTLIIAIIGYVATSAYRANKQLNEQISKVTFDEDIKHGRIYARLDEVKKSADEKFVDVKICKMQHEYTDKQLKEIKDTLVIISADVRKLLSRSGVHKGDQDG